MLILLPPSETKAPGGSGAPLDLESLSFPELTEVRSQIIADLTRLSVEETLSALKLSDKLREDAEANAELLRSPTLPAIERYTGVLYDALDAATLSETARHRIAIGSALFGVVAATDPIPRYRLSCTSKLPTAQGTAPTMKARWGSALKDALSRVDGLVVDLRSGGYLSLGPAPSAITVRVEKEKDGKRTVVSHFNKHYKGLLARVLAEADADIHTADDLIAIAGDNGLEIHPSTQGKETLTLVVRD